MGWYSLAKHAARRQWRQESLFHVLWGLIPWRLDFRKPAPHVVLLEEIGTAFCVEAAQAVEVQGNQQMALTRGLWMALPPMCFLTLYFRVQGLHSVTACLYTTFFPSLLHSAVHGDCRLSWGLWEPLGIWNVWMIFIVTLSFFFFILTFSELRTEICKRPHDTAHT